VPVIDGTTEGLLAIGQLMEARDRRVRPHSFPAPVPDKVRLHWSRRLASAVPLTAIEAQALLADYDIPTVQTLNVASHDEAMAAAERMGWPVVLKTAEAGIDHKSEAGGVALGLSDEAALRAAYEKMVRLGPALTLSAMAQGRVEIAFGLLRDPQFGPLLLLAAGGLFIEALADRAVALPPVSHEEAHAMLSRLRIHRLMGALRNLPAVDSHAVAQAFARFSLLAQDLGDLIEEFDVNPLLVSENGVVAVDALVVTRAQAQKRTK
jgi:acyl-CoA synthetase (NDP forming)